MSSVIGAIHAEVSTPQVVHLSESGLSALREDEMSVNNYLSGAVCLHVDALISEYVHNVIKHGRVDAVNELQKGLSLLVRPPKGLPS